MLEGFWTLCREYGLLPPEGGVILAAVSGGADSMCLLSLLLEAGAQYDFIVEAAHFDHQIRQDSEQDCAFVQHWCDEEGVPLHIGRANIPEEAHARKQGLEETARQFRYRFLEETAAEIGADVIATAHNADDNGETVLLHLLRGSGLSGLGGMMPKRGNLVRPLLTTTRREIEAYNALHGVPHVEDSTNADISYTRNFIRHEVMPLLKERNPNVLSALNRCAESARADNAYLEQQAAPLAAQAVWGDGSCTLPAGVLAEAPEPLAVRALQQLAAALSPETVLSSTHRAAVLRLCREKDPSAFVPLPGALVARREYDLLVLERREETEEAVDFRPTPLSINSVTKTPEWTINAELCRCPEGKFNQPLTFYLKPGLYILRPRQPGDAITLPGRNKKMLKKLMIDGKIPSYRRELLPVFESEGKVAAVTGFGADCAFLPKAGEDAIRIVATVSEDVPL